MITETVTISLKQSLYDLIKSRTSDLGFAPIDVAATLPSLNKIRVGIDITLYLNAIVSASSVFTLQIFTSVTSSAISSIIGESILQGPHHGAQKSTNTGIPSQNLLLLNELLPLYYLPFTRSFDVNCVCL